MFSLVLVVVKVSILMDADEYDTAYYCEVSHCLQDKTGQPPPQDLKFLLFRFFTKSLPHPIEALFPGFT